MIKIIYESKTRYLSVLVFCFIFVFYIWQAFQFTPIYDPDSAYYFGVAKHIVETGTYSEPIIWNFLNDSDWVNRPPFQVNRPPFDYWAPLTSLIYIPFFYLFGPTLRVAALVAGFISFISLIVFFVVTKKLTDNTSMALIATISFAFVPSLLVFRFSVESVVINQIFLMLTFYCLLLNRFTLAVIGNFLAFLSRGDSSILSMFVLLYIILYAYFNFNKEFKKIAWPLLTFLALVMGYISYTYYFWRTFGAPAMKKTFYMWWIWQYYSYFHSYFQTKFVPFFDAVTRVLNFGYLSDTLELLLSTVRKNNEFLFFKFKYTFLIIAGAIFIPMTLNKKRKHYWVLLLIFLIIVPFFVKFAQPVVFNPRRALHSYIAFLYMAFFALFTFFISRTKKQWGKISVYIMMAGIIITPLFVGLKEYIDPQLFIQKIKNGNASKSNILYQKIKKLDAMLGKDVVLTDNPWYVIAATDNPAVVIPFDGISGIDKLARKYNARWVLLTDYIPDFAQTYKDIEPFIKKSGKRFNLIKYTYPFKTCLTRKIREL